MVEFPHLNLKPPTTFEEQIAVLKSRGLIIDSEMMALKLLERISYYRMSAYFLTEQVDGRFIEGTTFEKIIRIYEFDSKLRNLLLGIIEPIEIAFRTQIAYLIAHKYGNVGHLESSHFKRHDIFINALNKEFSRSSERFIEYHFANYHAEIPVWVSLEIVSLSVLSRFFSNMQQEDQAEIADCYYGVSAVYIRSWLKCMNDTRNICAHHGRIYNRHLPSKPKLFKSLLRENIEMYLLFSHLIAYKSLYLDKTDWDSKMIHLSALLEEYSSSIDLKYIGFPGNWHTFLFND
jgi:abortive infection bacteriophage resistance protein